jgi:hypothetical protein
MGLGYSNSSFDSPIADNNSAIMQELQIKLENFKKEVIMNHENTQDAMVEVEERAKHNENVLAKAIMLMLSEFQDIKKLLSEVLESR